MEVISCENKGRVRGVVRRFQPTDAGVFKSEPGVLAAGDAVGAIFDALDCLFEGELVGQVGGKFLVSHAGHGGQGRGVAAVEEPLYFIEKARFIISSTRRSILE